MCLVTGCPDNALFPSRRLPKFCVKHSLRNRKQLSKHGLKEDEQSHDIDGLVTSELVLIKGEDEEEVGALCDDEDEPLGGAKVEEEQVSLPTVHRVRRPGGVREPRVKKQ